MNILKEFALQEKCAYIKENLQHTHYKIIENCSQSACESLIERGFRRFGKTFFRPICTHCQACESLKIDARAFVFSKSHRRVLNRSQNFTIILQRPTMSTQHLLLFEKYHIHMSQKRGWDYHYTTAQNYYNSFVSGHHDFGYEILYFDKEKLIGVDLIDLLPDGVSSIYFYSDPDYFSYSLGKLSLLYQILYAKENNLSWIYLGYYVAACKSLAYKAEYKPHFILKGRPNIDETFEWYADESF